MQTARLLWSLIRYRPWLYLFAIIGDTCFFMGRLAFGLVLQAIFNILSSQTSATLTLWLLLALQVGIALARTFTDLAEWRGVAILNFSMQSLLRRNLLERIFERPGAHALPGSTGEAINILDEDADVIIKMLENTFITIALSLFAIVSLIILLHVNAEITLLVFAPILCVVLIAQSMKKRLEKYRDASRVATGRLTSLIGEIFSSVLAIQVAGAEPHIIEHFNTLNKQRRSAMLKDRVLTTGLNSVFSNTTNIGTGLILILAALSVRGSHLRVGDLALFIYYLSSISDFVQNFGSLLASYPQTGISFQRMTNLLQGASPITLVAHHPLYLTSDVPPLPAMQKTEADQLKVLDVQALSYNHSASERGISNINLHIMRGTLTVITGRIGSGKTTLLRVLLGLLPHDAGNVYWNGHPVAHASAFFVPPRSAYTPQVPHLFSDTLQENILLGMPTNQTTLDHAIHTAVMERDIASLEDGLSTLIGTHGVKLSGGQAQRTAAARMLMRDAELLVFDDLSSALDVETEQTLWERLFAQEGRTYLVVSHRKSVLQQADHIVVLKDGMIESEGKLAELLATSEEMQRLWHGDIR